jgi:OOP family OmpA-OmpF porin
MRRSCSIESIRRVLAPTLVLGAMLIAACAPPPPPPAVPEPPPPPPPKVELPPPPKEEPPPPPPPAPEPVKLPAPVTFATGTATLTSDSEVALNHVFDYIKKSPDVAVLRIEGHTDSQGLKTKNLKLSEERAQAVAKWLVGHGVDCKRVLPVGFGDSDPVADNASEEGRAQNRRTVFVDNRNGHAGGHAAGDPCTR